MIPEFAVYLFDVDGTLLDSATDICGAVRGSLAGTPYFNCDEAFLRRYIGLHLSDMYRDLFPGDTQEQIDERIKVYRSIYPARGHHATKVFPGVREGLEHLGGRKSTATTKGTETTRQVLELFGLLPFFDRVQGTDGFPAKPAPDVILASLAGLGASPSECLLIGDSPADMEAGRRAGVKTCAVRYGYGSVADLERWKPDYWIDDLRELDSMPANGRARH